MSKIQEVFNRILETKREIKEIKAMYKDALTNSAAYQEVLEEMKTLKEKKKKIEDGIKEDFASELDKLEVLNTDLKSDKELLADASLSELMKGNTVEVEDAKGNKFFPSWAVKYKRE